MKQHLSMLCAALALAATAMPAFAASSASSQVSDSASTSVGSLSDSVGKSSDSSKGTPVAQGDYRVIEVAALDTGTGTGLLRVKLQAMADAGVAGELELTLPSEAVERGRLLAGVTITANIRPYGVEFAAGSPRAAFFLALHDEWYRELNSTPVVL